MAMPAHSFRTYVCLRARHGGKSPFESIKQRQRKEESLIKFTSRVSFENVFAYDYRQERTQNDTIRCEQVAAF